MVTIPVGILGVASGETTKSKGKCSHKGQVLLPPNTWQTHRHKYPRMLWMSTIHQVTEPQTSCTNPLRNNYGKTLQISDSTKYYAENDFVT
jgi:hypothetical protein